MIETLRNIVATLPPMAKFAIGMGVIVVVPRMSQRLGIPGVVGLLLAGVAFGPHVLDIFGENHPIASFFSDLGKLLLMFFAGLEIDLALFRQKRFRSILFGVMTTAIPLVLGTQVALWLGYGLVPSIVVGSLLASHTLLGMSIVRCLGAANLEPIVVTVGATVMSDTLSLVVFATCVPIFVGGFSISALTIQLVEIIVFVPLVLLGLGHAGGYVLRKLESDESVYFIVLLAILAATALLAQAVNLPGIVGTFLAGLAVNATVHDKPAATKLEFFGNSLFIPIFFFVTGFLIDPVVFARSLIDHFPMSLGIIGALLTGKWIAAQIAGRAFGYSANACKTVWSLTLPQVAATLAATLVAFDTRNATGQRLLDEQMLNAVLVMLVFTSILGPVLTERFAPSLASEHPEPGDGVKAPA